MIVEKPPCGVNGSTLLGGIFALIYQPHLVVETAGATIVSG